MPLRCTSVVGYLPDMGDVLGFILSTAKRRQHVLWVEIACCVVSPWSFLGPTCFLSLGHVFGGLPVEAAFSQRLLPHRVSTPDMLWNSQIPPVLHAFPLACTLLHTHTRSRSPRLPRLDALGCSPTHALFDIRMTWRLPGFQSCKNSTSVQPGRQ